MFAGHPVIDGDSHKVENWLVLKEHLPAALRDRIRPVVCARGYSRVAFMDRDPTTGRPELERVFAKPEGLGKGLFAAFHPESTLGALFNRVRVEHMDREGIDLGVVYPTVALALNGLLDVELAVALARAYNDYILEDVAPYADRLFPVAMLPVVDTAAAVEELDRMWARGVIGVAVPPCIPVPHPEAPEAFPRLAVPLSITDARFRPIFERAVALGAPVGIHGAGPGMSMPGGIYDFTDSFMINHIFAHRNQMQLVLTRCLFDGLFQALPTLRLGFLEGGCGWLPDLAHAFHEHWEKRVRDFEPDLQMDLPAFIREMKAEVGEERMRTLALRHRRDLPSQMVFKAREGALSRKADRGDRYTWESDLAVDPRELLRQGRFVLGFESDDPSPGWLPAALGAWAEDVPMFSVDYGHWDGEVEGCVRRVAEDPRLSVEARVKILGGNAVRFYGERLRAAAASWALRQGSASAAVASQGAEVSSAAQTPGGAVSPAA